MRLFDGASPGPWAACLWDPGQHVGQKVSQVIINTSDNPFSIKICVIAHKNKRKDNCLYFYLSEPGVLEEAAGYKSCFALTLISQNRHFHMWRDMLMKYLSLKYSESILAFQLQFGTYKAESEHFRWEKEKRHFTEWFSR